jgi:hypothetical protein
MENENQVYINFEREWKGFLKLYCMHAFAHRIESVGEIADRGGVGWGEEESWGEWRGWHVSISLACGGGMSTAVAGDKISIANWLL